MSIDIVLTFPVGGLKCMTMRLGLWGMTKWK